MPTDKPSAERARALYLKEWSDELQGEMWSGEHMIKFAEHVAALAVERRDKEIAKMFCGLCRKGVPMRSLSCHTFVDDRRTDIELLEHASKCQAAAIWARDAERG